MAPMLAQGLSCMRCRVGTIVDLETNMRVRATMDFQLCPVSGHNTHGQVEARIKHVQLALEKVGFYKECLHATGLQTA